MTPIILATSNGSGMGHLSRQIALGLALARRDDTEALLFSMSGALPLVSGLGLRSEYCPSYQRGWMPRRFWQDYLRDRVLALLDETGARVFVFDGVAPYQGLLRARIARPNVAFVWFRRGLWKPDVNVRSLRAAPFFDLVIEPGDLAADADRGATAGLPDAVRVGPVTLASAAPVLTRRAAASALGLDPDRPAVLVTLPADLSGDERGGGPAGVAIDALLGCPEWQIAVTRTPLAADGTPLVDRAGVTELRGIYPLVSYLSAFDAAVGAGGYNAVHELLLAGLPSLLIPSPGALTDDQQARARWAQSAGLALTSAPGDREGIAAGIARLLSPDTRDGLASACRALPPPRGAEQAADILTDLDSGFSRHRVSPAERVARRELAGAGSLARVVHRVLGPPAVAAIRRALGRAARPDPPQPLGVHLVDADKPPYDDFSYDGRHRKDPGEAAAELACLITQQLDPAVVRAGNPLVEHLMPGTSTAYRARRRHIAERYYRVERAGLEAAGSPARRASSSAG